MSIYSAALGKVEFSDTEDFDSATGEIYVELDSFADEGNSLPDPESITAAMAGGHDAPTNDEAEFALRPISAELAELQTLKAASYGRTTLFMRLTTVDGDKEDVYSNVRLSNVQWPALAEYGSLTSGKIDGKAISSSADGVFTTSSTEG